MFTAIPAFTNRLSKLESYIASLDARSRRNLEGHLANPEVSTSDIRFALRAEGFSIGTTAIRGHRAKLAFSQREATAKYIQPPNSRAVRSEVLNDDIEHPRSSRVRAPR